MVKHRVQLRRKKVRVDVGVEVEILEIHEACDERCVSDDGSVRRQAGKRLRIGRALRTWAIVTGAAMGTALVFWERVIDLEVMDFIRALIQ